jgi:methionine-rich copper-binding protein CopC
MRNAFFGFLLLACGGPALQENTNPTVDTTQASVPPSIKTTIPGSGDVDIAVSSMITIVFATPMDARTIDAHTIYLSDGTPGMVAWRGGRTATLLPKGGLRFATTYTVVIAADVASEDGNTFGTDTTFTFTTAAAPTKALPTKEVPDTSAPVLTHKEPAADAADVPLTGVITLFFNEALKASTVTAQSVSLSRDGIKLESSLAVNGDTVTLTPAASLVYGATYTVAVSADVTDAAGNALVAQTWHFSTRPPPDETPPVVTQSLPADAATEVEQASTLVLTFSEAITPDSATVTLKDGANVEVVLTVTYGPTTLTVTPSAPLAAGTHYTLSVSGVTDVSDNALNSPYSLGFTTKQ